MRNIISYVLIMLCSAEIALAQDFSIVAVGKAELQQDKMVVSDAFGTNGFSSSQKKIANEFADVIRNDFSFYKKKFDVLKDLSRSVKTSGTIKYSFWNSKKVALVVRINAEKKKDNVKLNVSLYDVEKKKELEDYEKTVSSSNVRTQAHDVADKMYRKITGKESIFNSKIYFVSDRTGSRKNPQKELFVMDFDGGNATQITNHKGTVISPAVSPDRSRVLYSLIKNTRSRKRNVNLYMMDVKTRKATLVSNKKGINSGAIFTPDGKSIILTLSHTGNADLYKFDLDTSKLIKITSHYSADVDPSISRDGRLLAFLSDRPGKAMIYTLNPSGTEKNVNRISFVGKYNATPRFSPDGKEIAFSSWMDNRFDIFRIGSDGKGLSRLTKDFGSNEDPTYSNDGEFIAFSSQRVLSRKKAVQNIYIMDRDGEIVGQVTKNFGNCITPRWSK